MAGRKIDEGGARAASHRGPGPPRSLAQPRGAWASGWLGVPMPGHPRLLARERGHGRPPASIARGRKPPPKAMRKGSTVVRWTRATKRPGGDRLLGPASRRGCPRGEAALPPLPSLTPAPPPSGRGGRLGLLSKGGQAGTSSRIENYLGFSAGVSGEELASRALQQARRHGAEIIVTRAITRIDAATHQVHLDGGDVLTARTVILACGVAWRQLSIEGFERLAGKGISYGAARSEAASAHGLDVHIVGAGNSAGQAS